MVVQSALVTPVHYCRLGGSAQGVIVLGATTNVIEREVVVGLHAIELRKRQVVDMAPGLAAIPAGIDAAVAPNNKVIRVCRIDPQRVVINMAMLGGKRGKTLACILGHCGESV